MDTPRRRRHYLHRGLPWWVILSVLAVGVAIAVATHSRVSDDCEARGGHLETIYSTGERGNSYTCVGANR